ncbi:MAG: tetratricopeptide repeat protein [Verrucomicrobiales bacterium]
MLADLALLELDAPDLRDRAAPFAGRWHAPVSPALPHNQALALMRDGFLEEGSAYLKKLLTDAAAGKTSRPPGFPQPGGSDYALLCERAADYYRLLESPDDVVAAMRLALRFDPEFLPAHLALGRAFSRAGRPAEGEAHLRKAAARLPDDPDLRNDLGIALAMQGRLADAEIEFRAAIDRRPDLAGAHENLARALEGQKKSAEAIEVIARLAEIYAAAGRPADARRAAQRGLDLIRAGDGGTAELRGRLESLAAE